MAEKRGHSSGWRRLGRNRCGSGERGDCETRGVFEHVEFEMPISHSRGATEGRIGYECGTWKGNKGWRTTFGGLEYTVDP